MKRLPIILIVLSIIFSTKIIAQHQVEAVESDYKVMNNYEIATGKMSDSKYMFKLTSIGGRLQDFNLGFEYKLYKSFSLGVNFTGSTFYSLVTNPTPIVFDTLPILSTFETVKTYQLEASLEGRYYINQENLIDAGFGNNLNGIYAVAGVRTQLYNSFLNEERYTPYMGLGIQSRILKYGLLDFALLVEMENNQFSIYPGLKAGFAFSKDYKLLDFENARCNILKCFDERKYLIKIPIKGLLSINYFPDVNYVGIFTRPTVEIEHRLMKGVSMNHGFSGLANMNLNFDNEIASNISQADIGYSNELRYYFLKRKSIAKGRSADNLSGPYIATSFHASRSYINFLFSDGFVKHQDVLYGGLNLGYQTRLFKKFYFDVNAYLGRQEVKSISGLLTNPGAYTRYGINFDFGVLL